MSKTKMKQATKPEQEAVTREEFEKLGKVHQKILKENEEIKESLTSLLKAIEETQEEVKGMRIVETNEMIDTANKSVYLEEELKNERKRHDALLDYVVAGRNQSQKGVI